MKVKKKHYITIETWAKRVRKAPKRRDTFTNMLLVTKENCEENGIYVNKVIHIIFILVKFNLHTYLVFAPK